MTASAAPAPSGLRRALSGLRRAPQPRFALLLLLGAAALGWSVARLLGGEHPTPLELAVAVGLLVPGLLLRADVRIGLNRHSVEGGYEAVLLVALVLVPGPHLVPVAAAVLLGRELLRRKPLLRALLSTSGTAAPLALALLLLERLDPPAGPAGWLEVALTVAVANAVNELLMDGVVAAATGSRTLVLLRRDAASTAWRLLLNLGAGAALLAAVQGQRWELLVALPVLGWWLLRAQRERLDRETVTEALPRMVLAAQRLDAEDDEELVREVLSRTAAMFGVRRAQLVLLDWPGTGDRTWTLGTDGRCTPSTGRAATDGPHVVSRALVSGTAVPVAFGELRLHFLDSQRLTAADEQVLSALVLTASSALSRARAHLEQALAARRDHLTGLANRLELQEQLDRRLPELLDRHADDPRSPGMALLLVDLDHFKEVNDTLGHSAGDRVLVELASRLERALRPDDVVVRLGGDEFALLLVDVEGREQARLIAQAVLRRLGAPVVVDGLDLPVEASVGVALAPEDGTCGDELLRRADIAMYRAKGERNAVVVYDPAMDSGREEQFSLLGQLQAALGSGQIVVHYQPIVSLADGRVMGAEALVRWQHPVRGLLFPGAFVPATERTELVVPLTVAVLDSAVREAVGWSVVAGNGVTLSVNLSPRCLLDRTLPEQVSRVLARHGLPARRLMLEITETLALSELEVVEEVLQSLRELGVRISLDDFGTGFSSMSALRRLAVNEVKIDRSFVTDALQSRGARAVVDATVTLAHGLGVPVVGEGVETPEQLELLRSSGCDRAQGYLLGRPVDAASFRARLAEPATVLPLPRRGGSVRAG